MPRKKQTEAGQLTREVHCPACSSVILNDGTALIQQSEKLNDLFKLADTISALEGKLTLLESDLETSQTALAEAKRENNRKDARIIELLGTTIREEKNGNVGLEKERNGGRNKASRTGDDW